MDEDCTYFLCILTFSIKFVVFTEYEKTSIQTKQNPLDIFVRHFSFLSDKYFQTVGSCRATTKKISQRLQADGNNTALSPTLQLRKSHRGSGLNVKPPAISQHCRDNQKVIPPHISPAIPPLPCRWGAVDTNDWCITFTRSIRIGENLGLRPRFITLPSGPCAMLTQWRIQRGFRWFTLETMLLPNRVPN